MSALDTVLVGTDGSENARAAVRWAAVEADRRGAALRVVHAYDELWATVPDRPDLGIVEVAHAGAETVAADARLAVAAVAPAVDVRADAVAGDPAAVLLEAAATAGLVVLGSRGRGSLTGLMLGSTSRYVATHAPCPAAVVRGRTWAVHGPVVVGTGGLESDSRVLRVAFEEAADRHADLLAVRAFRMPTMAYTPGMPAVVTTAAECADSERAALAEQLAPWRAKFPAVRVDTSVPEGDAAHLLVTASRTAQLVVVGDRGWSALVRTVLGSVATELLHHANCPVLIAR